MKTFIEFLSVADWLPNMKEQRIEGDVVKKIAKASGASIKHARMVWKTSAKS